MMLKMQDLILRLVENTFNDEVDNGEGESTDNEADDGVENSVFGFFDFGSVTRRSHILNATDDNESYRNEATN